MYMKKKSWDVADVTSQIHNIARECTSGYNDGYVAWGCKQDLYQLKFLLDDALFRCPSFGDIEEEYLKLEEQKRIIKILKK